VRRVARIVSRRNRFSSFPSGLDWRRGKPGGHACGVGTLFPVGTAFPHSLRFASGVEKGDVRRESQSSSAEQVFLMPAGGQDWAPRKQELGPQSPSVLFLDGTTLPRSLRAWIGGDGSQEDTLAASGHFFPVGTAFPPSLQFTETLGRTARCPGALWLDFSCMEIVEFWQYRKRTRRCSYSFRQHPDAILAKVAQKMAPLGEMQNL